MTTSWPARRSARRVTSSGLGQRQIPVRWIDLGPVSISPGLRYMLSPNGPERQVRTRYKIGSRVGQGYMRWSDALPTAQTGLLRRRGRLSASSASRVRTRVAVDLWRNPDRSTGVRSEVASSFRPPAGRRFVASFALGAKGRGYLQGYPLASGVYVNVGGGIRF